MHACVCACVRTFLLRHRVRVDKRATTLVPVVQTVVEDEVRLADVRGRPDAVERPIVGVVLPRVRRLEGRAAVHLLARVADWYVRPRRLCVGKGEVSADMLISAWDVSLTCKEPRATVNRPK